MDEKNLENCKKESYKSNIKVLFDKSQDDYIWVEISINEEIANLLSEVCVKDLQKEKCEVYINTFMRYKVKGWLINSLSFNNYKNILFHEKLIEEKKIELKFDNINNCLTTIQGYKDVMKLALQNILKCKALNMEIEYTKND
jgi:hypothetical protein